MKMKFSALALFLPLLALPADAQAQGKLELSKGDHIAVIGNTLGDRWQHEGTLEAMLHAKYPQHNLTVRTLAVSGDELTMRSRSENFGSPDEWLAKVKADVVVAMFGFNESFKGQDGLGEFKQNLEKFIKDTRGKNYNGKGAPKLVLFSPIAWEDLKNPDFRDGKSENHRISYYVEAMAEIARANNVPFVDLFKLSQEAYAKASEPLTVNGIHLRDSGYQALAPAVFQALTGETAPVPDKSLVAAVNEKNWEWHQRYRTVDGYNVYGGRSRLAYEDGKGGPKVSNFEVMQQEMSVRDVRTESRDKVVWAAAAGKSVKPDDSNVPPVRKIRTNKPGDRPDELHTFLSGEAAIAKMKVHAGCKVSLFASEEQFPDLINPVQMAWDTRGRLWVAAWRNYPERTPDSPKGDSLLVFEDTNDDGRADKMTAFVDDLNCPTGFQFWKDGVLIMQAPDLWFLRDTNGDGRADTKEILVNGMDSADSHHTTNAMVWEPGGATFFSDGVFHRTQVETSDGPLRNSDGAIYRFEPRTGKFETYMLYGFANPHGKVFDRWGRDLITDATGNNTYYAPAVSGKLDSGKHSGIKQFWDRPSRPCPGTGMVSSRHFPEDWQGNYLNCNVITFQGIYRVKVSEDGSGLTGETLPDLISSSDPNFRPSAVSVGPDGAIYFCDWSNAIIGHMQHHLRDPNRDKQHGRIYRITYDGRPLLKPAKIAGQPVEKLLDLLKEPEDNVRERAKIELETHPAQEIHSALKKWVAGLDKSAKECEHHLTEALWTLQWNNVVDVDFLKQRLQSPVPQARGAAVRVLCYWRDRVPDALALLKTAAGDADPYVRLQAVRACSFFRTWEAADAALVALGKPMDYYLDYIMKETLKQLEPWWKKALEEGKPLCEGNAAGVDFLLGNVSSQALASMQKTPLVLTALLTRNDVPETDRLIAATTLAERNKTTLTEQYLQAIDGLASRGGKALDDLCRLVLRQPAVELKNSSTKFTMLGNGKSTPDNVRRMAQAALMTASGSVDAAWEEGSKSAAGLADFLGAVTMISDPAVRPAAHDKILPLLSGLPPAIAGELGSAKTGGRYVRIELPRNGTLTLAEVEVLSEGKNVARSGVAKQIATSNGGEASRAIDGNTDGAYNSGTQTHTPENIPNPWWEVDLKQEYPINAVVIWNRSEENGTFASRLDGFTLTVLDGNRREVFKQAGIPAPKTSSRIDLKGDPAGALRRSAIKALVAAGKEPAANFKTLSALVSKPEDRLSAVQGIMQLPRAAWQKVEGGAAARAILEWAKTTPQESRTQQDYLEITQAAAELAALLPDGDATALRRELRGLGVPVFVVKTVREQMRFDQGRLIVEVGKPFEVIFENEDALPHNFVITEPNARNDIGTKAQALDPSKKDRQGRLFVPADSRVLNATKLLEAGEKQTLKVAAIAKEGEYDYVCTFPGHWMIMWGKLIVTKDIDAYLKQFPQPKELPPTFALPAESK